MNALTLLETLLQMSSAGIDLSQVSLSAEYVTETSPNKVSFIEESDITSVEIYNNNLRMVIR